MLGVSFRSNRTGDTGILRGRKSAFVKSFCVKYRHLTLTSIVKKNQVNRQPPIINNLNKNETLYSRCVI